MRLPIAGALSVVLVLGGCGLGSTATTDAVPSSGGAARAPAPAATTPAPPATAVPQGTPVPPGTQPPAPAEADRTEPDRTEAVSVSYVLDGDSFAIPWAKVRIIGIDAPEYEDCGFAAATAKAKELIGASGGQVTLVSPAGNPDVDRYGRLLRSVTLADGTDFGTAMIAAGTATARYDSLDGYARHPQQDDYRAAAESVAADPALWAPC